MSDFSPQAGKAGQTAARSPGWKRWNRRLLRTGIGTLLAAAALLGAFWWRYPGFCEFIWADLRHASWEENRDQFGFLYFYSEYLGRLRPSGEEGFVDFPPPPSHEGPLQAGKIWFLKGHYEQAIEDIGTHIRQSGESEDALLWLAMAHMRRGERENCLHRLRPGSNSGLPAATAGNRVCVLPVAMAHRNTDDIEAAARALERILERHAPRDPLYRWLLNLAYIAAGRNPGSIPQKHLIHSDFIDQFYGRGREEARQRYPELRFTDRAGELGVDLLDAGKGVAVEDFDGDGDLDLVTGGTFGRLHYFRNLEGERFEDASEEAGLRDVLQPFIVTAADYDNDGAMDLFASRPLHHFQLLRNDGRGVFQDATASAGLAEPQESRGAAFTFASAWGDIDNDGDLDLFVAQFGQRLPFSEGIFARPPAPSRLYLNEGGRFRDASRDYGLASILEDRIFFGADFGDYDRDGWMDLFLSGYARGQSRLLRNVEGRRFEDSGLIQPSEAGFMAAFVDVDQDGRLDVFQGGQSPARTAVMDAVLRHRPLRNASRIYHQSQGGFRDRRDWFDPPLPAGTMGANFGDLDNDGCHDFYLGTGNPEPWYVLPNLMYAGIREGTRCTGRMGDISMLQGFGTIQKGHGIVFFDFDGDGDQDIYSSLGGMWPEDAWPNQLLVNESKLGRAWVKIRLRGRRSNRFGLGATIEVTAENEAGETIRRTRMMNNGTGFGSSPYLAHIGLLDAARVRRASVRWPASRCTAQYELRLNELNWLDEAACERSSKSEAAVQAESRGFSR